MNKYLLAGVALIAMGGITFAADATSELAPFDWSGPYVGGNLGYGWGKQESIFLTPVDLNPQFVSAPDSSLLAPPTADYDMESIEPQGFLGGVQIGYNIQNGRVVFGIEGDIELSNINASSPWTEQTDTALGEVHFRSSEETEWFGTVRGRLGFAVSDPVLLYITGGLAFGDVGPKVETLLTDLSGNHTSEADSKIWSAEKTYSDRELKSDPRIMPRTELGCRLLVNLPCANVWPLCSPFQCAGAFYWELSDVPQVGLPETR